MEAKGKLIEFRDAELEAIFGEVYGGGATNTAYVALVSSALSTTPGLTGGLFAVVAKTATHLLGAKDPDTCAVATAAASSLAAASGGGGLGSVAAGIAGAIVGYTQTPYCDPK